MGVCIYLSCIHCIWVGICIYLSHTGFPRGKESTCCCRRYRTGKRYKFDPWVRKIPWSCHQQPTPVFWPGKLHGQRSLTAHCPQGRKEADTTEHMCTHNADLWHLRVYLFITYRQIHDPFIDRAYSDIIKHTHLYYKSVLFIQVHARQLNKKKRNIGIIQENGKIIALERGKWLMILSPFHLSKNRETHWCFIIN